MNLEHSCYGMPRLQETKFLWSILPQDCSQTFGLATQTLLEWMWQAPARDRSLLRTSVSDPEDFFFLFLFVLRFYLVLFIWVHCSCLQTHKKSASDPITDGCESPCGFWELNSGLLEEQSVLLTAEPSLQSSFLFSINHFIHLHFKWYPCFQCMTPIPSAFPFASLRMLLHPLTHSHLIALESPYNGTSSLHRTKGPPPIDSRKGHPLLHMYLESMIPSCILFGWWFSLRDLWMIQWVDIVLPMGMQSPSAPSLLPLALPLGSLGSVQWLTVQWLAVSFCICISQVLAEPFREQPYQAPLSKHFLLSATVWGFGVYRWDGSLG
jgi:hypothetical protein